jgi:hypothetical protein
VTATPRGGQSHPGELAPAGILGRRSDDPRRALDVLDEHDTPVGPQPPIRHQRRDPVDLGFGAHVDDHDPCVRVARHQEGGVVAVGFKDAGAAARRNRRAVARFDVSDGQSLTLRITPSSNASTYGPATATPAGTSENVRNGPERGPTPAGTTDPLERSAAAPVAIDVPVVTATARSDASNWLTDASEPGNDKARAAPAGLNAVNIARPRRVEPTSTSSPANTGPPRAGFPAIRTNAHGEPLGSVLDTAPQPATTLPPPPRPAPASTSSPSTYPQATPSP